MTQHSSEQPKEYIITADEHKEVVEFIRFWTTAFRNGCSEKDRLRLSRVGEILDNTRSRPHPAPTRTVEHMQSAYAHGVMDGARKAREDVQPFIDFVRVISTKRNEMLDLMCRNKIKIDNLDDPMQKLAFTFYSEIGEMAHKAEVIIEESTQQQAGRK